MTQLRGLTVVLLALIGTSALAADLSPTTKEQLREMLMVGFERGRHALPEAKAIYESLQKSGESSAELHFAYGLVLLKQFKSKEAVEQFRQAVEDSDTPYWPAWQALIWMHFSTKETTAGYDRLFDLAKRFKPAPAAEQKALARWTGQLLAGLEHVAESKKAQETVQKQDQRLQELLGADLIPNYEEGRLDAEDRAFLLDREIKETRQEQAAKNAEERKEKQAKLAEATQSAKKLTESVKKSADDWHRWLDDQLSQFDRLLGRLEKDYAVLERRAQSLVESQQQIDREINAASYRLQGGETSRISVLGPTRLGNPTTEQRIDQLLNQKLQLQLEFDRFAPEALAISQRAAAVIRERNVAIQKYQSETGELVKQEAALDKWQERLKKNGKKLKAPVTAKGAAVTQKLTQARSLKTYLDFDLEDARLRILDRIAAKAPPPAIRAAEIQKQRPFPTNDRDFDCCLFGEMP